MGDTPETPVLQISCRPAPGFKVGSRVRSGVLITTADILLLRRLAERDIVVRLVCDGMRPYHALVRLLLRRAVQVPGRQDWFVPTSPTGPLKSPLPSPKAD